MTSDELRAVRGRLGLSREQMALKLNTPVRTYEGWELGRTIPGIVSAAVKLIERYESPARITHE